MTEANEWVIVPVLSGDLVVEADDSMHGEKPAGQVTCRDHYGPHAITSDTGAGGGSLLGVRDVGMISSVRRIRIRRADLEAAAATLAKYGRDADAAALMEATGVTAPVLKLRGEDRKLVRNRARCRGCGDEIESTARHEYVTCSCGKLAVDGGLSYTRRGYDTTVGYDELSEYEGDTPGGAVRKT